MNLHSRTFIDKRLPKQVIESGGFSHNGYRYVDLFSHNGYRYVDLFYHYWRESKSNELWLIITHVPAIFINNNFINKKCIEKLNERKELK